MSANSENLAMAKDWERSVFIPIPKKSNAKLPYSWTHFTCSLRLCSKSFELGFSSTRTKNFQMYRLSFSKAEESEIKLPILVVS